MFWYEVWYGRCCTETTTAEKEKEKRETCYMIGSNHLSGWKRRDATSTSCEERIEEES